MTAPRGLSAEEAAAWDRLAATVTPLHPRPVRRLAQPIETKGGAEPETMDKAMHRVTPVLKTKPRVPVPADTSRVARRLPDPGLDSHWDRKLKAGSIQPDFTLDLHGHNLDRAYDRLMSGIAQARAMGARTILLVTGKSRPVAAADRADQRGAIRAKVLDWLAASGHHSAIAAVRRAHQRHGGEGAIYIVLRREG
ncbi:Smr/MutS family protein [Qipengyuania sp. RANM35]|uniref:Smr/MutS family protein n=1 Tax=Qipengyuania sp. RANM35 TaxID=3068635 RepID=UPI0034DB1F1F